MKHLSTLAALLITAASFAAPLTGAMAADAPAKLANGALVDAKGALLGLALDLTLRATGKTSLDDVMRELRGRAPGDAAPCARRPTATPAGLAPSPSTADCRASNPRLARSSHGAAAAAPGLAAQHRRLR